MARVPRKITRKGVYQTSTHLAAVLLVLIVFISAAAVMMLSGPRSGQDQRAPLEALAAGRALWTSSRPDAYRYVVERTCNCPSEDSVAYVATERFGERSAQFRVPVESASGEFLSAPPRPVWIPDLFALVEQALLAKESVTVTYDAQLGYPSYISIAATETAPDGARTYAVRDFEVLREWAPDR